MFSSYLNQSRYLADTANDALYTSIQTGASTVVFVGTSITEGVGAQMEIYNGYVEEFMRGLSNKFSDVAFSYYNYGLGSRTIYNLQDSNFKGVASPDPGDGTGYYRAADTYSWQSASVIGKSWMDQLEDSSPDLIVLEYGINTNVSVALFATYLTTIITTIQGWNKVPSIVLMTEMLPTLDSDPYLDKNGTIKLYNEIIREYAQTYNCSLIDVAKNWQLLRDGQDPTVQIQSRIALDTLTKITGSTAALTYNSMILAGTNCNYSPNTDEHRNANITGDYTPTGIGSNVQVGIRFSKAKSESWAVGIVVQIFDTSVVFWENGSTLQTTAHTAITVPNTHAFEIDIVGDTIIVKLDTVTVATYTVTLKFDYGNISLGINDATLSNVNMTITDMFPVVQTAKYTSNELVGNKTATEWNNGDQADGGNAINHPSRIGLREGFYPAIRDYIIKLFK